MAKRYTYQVVVFGTPIAEFSRLREARREAIRAILDQSRDVPLAEVKRRPDGKGFGRYLRKRKWQESVAGL